MNTANRWEKKKGTTNETNLVKRQSQTSLEWNWC